MKEPWNWQTFFIWNRMVFTFRVLGFGVVIYDAHTVGPAMWEHIQRKAWFVQIMPGLYFAFVAPWV